MDWIAQFPIDRVSIIFGNGLRQSPITLRLKSNWVASEGEERAISIYSVDQRKGTISYYPRAASEVAALYSRRFASNPKSAPRITNQTTLFERSKTGHISWRVLNDEQLTHDADFNVEFGDELLLGRRFRK